MIMEWGELGREGTFNRSLEFCFCNVRVEGSKINKP